MTALLRAYALIVALLVMVAGSTAQAGPSLLFDPATGEVISQERAGEPWYPASLTKLMTAYVVFQELRAGRLRLDQQVPVSEAAQAQPPSKLGLKAGRTIAIDLALQMLLVYSANDMAVVLAEAVGATIPQFVAKMNAAAQGLGMTGSHFANPNGLFDQRQVSTARDLALLATALLKEFPEHVHYFSQPDVAIGKRRLRNRNMLLRQMATADGMKTGFICDSGYNLIASATQDGRRLVAIVFGARNGKSRADLAEMLLNSGFARPEPAGARVMVHEIADIELGTLVPADMTPVVCKGKNPVAMARAADLAGWGVSLGLYGTPEIANKALRGRLLGARDIGGGPAGVIKMPGGAGYSALVWGLEQKASLDLCAHFQQKSAYCDVMTPESFDHLAALAKEETAAQPQVIQGSDAAPPKAMKTPAKVKKTPAKVKKKKKPRRKKVRRR